MAEEKKDAFEDAIQTHSSLWTPLHIHTTQNKEICSPEETCQIYESLLQSINSDIEILNEVIEITEIEQQCIKELLYDTPHWMGFEHGTKRKLIECTENLENIESKLNNQSDFLAVNKTNLNLGIIPTRSRENSKESSKTSSTPKSKSSSKQILDTLEGNGQTGSKINLFADLVISKAMIKIASSPHSPTTHYVFNIKKVNSKFWSTSARLLHIDLDKKDVFITYKTEKNQIKKTENDSTIANACSKGSLSESIKNSEAQSESRSNSSLCECENDNGRTIHKEHSPIQITRSSKEAEPESRLVDLFRDPQNVRFQAVLVFKCLKTQEPEHDKLVFKPYLFESECDLIKCESLIYNHILGALTPDMIINSKQNRRVINTRKLASIQIEVHLDDSATRAARKLVKIWMSDNSKDEILQIKEVAPKRIRLWMTTNAKFIAVSTIKIILMLGCVIHKIPKTFGRSRSGCNTKTETLDLAEIRWLATAASRHVYSIWRDRDKINNQSYGDNDEEEKGLYSPSVMIKYEQLGIAEKNRLIQETVLIIDHLLKDGFKVIIPKQIHPYMF